MKIKEKNIFYTIGIQKKYIQVYCINKRVYTRLNIYILNFNKKKQKLKFMNSNFNHNTTADDI